MSFVIFVPFVPRPWPVYAKEHPWFTRRRVFWSLAAALVAGRAVPASAQGTALPPSLAALTSIRAQAKPITNPERRARIEKARRLMAAHKIDAIMLTQGTSLVYFTNIRWGGGERLTACIVPAKGDPFFVCPAFEEDRAREQIELGPFGDAASARHGHGRARMAVPGEEQHVRVGEGADAAAAHDRGEFGVRLEDDLHVTENGAELFTPQSESLERPFGA